MERELESKVQYFFASRYRGREDVRDTVRELRRHGRLVLVGGMLRDLALFGNTGFRSDLDFVIAPYDLRSFEKYMTAIGARVNRFGGYALPSRKWQIDVWPLERTWANVAGHAKVRTVGDLRRATFFRCDAILYDLDHRKLKTTPDYFGELNQKVLEINLRPNPNPKGNTVRAFRYALMKGFRWGPRLSDFVNEVLEREGWNELLEAEWQSFHTQHLERIRFENLRKALQAHVSEGLNTPFDVTNFLRNVQLALPNLH
ncbi:hypothetical protein [Thioclava electrotropha]|uniref:Poly A polymerase head domain-containing protein n=1 Tax=Thioclava electrotropha TaxID=1549850 RepID=A0ABX6YVQ8_9RHOB|nr:hypothetical protein [Thioclava electrotropha]QPZ91939.1 hypothetical protein AKL02_014285 [Thioclava electrotropha]